MSKKNTKSKATNRRIVDYGQILMWGALLVSMPRWAGAFIAADSTVIPHVVEQGLQAANVLAGIGMGFIEVLGAAYLLDAWGKMKPRKRHNSKHLDHKWVILTGFVAGLFILMPFILAPYIFVRMDGTSLAQLPAWFRSMWAVAVVVSPGFIVGGVAVAQGDLVSSASTMPAKSQHSASTKAAGKKAKAPEPAPASTVPAVVGQVITGQCPDCGKVLNSNTVQALNAHKRFCKAKELPAASANGAGGAQ